MPAKSKAQQHFMGMVYAAKKGELENPSPAVKKAADSISLKDAKKFAETKTKKLPKKVKENVVDNSMSFSNYLILESDIQEGLLDALRFGRGALKKVGQNIGLDAVVTDFGRAFDKHVLQSAKAGRPNVGSAKPSAMNMSKMSAPVPAPAKKPAMDMSKLSAAPAAPAPAPAKGGYTGYLPRPTGTLTIPHGDNAGLGSYTPPQKRELELEPLETPPSRKKPHIRARGNRPVKRKYQDFDEIKSESVTEGIFSGVMQAGHDEVLQSSAQRLQKLAQYLVQLVKQGKVSADDLKYMLKQKTSNFGEAWRYLSSQLQKAGYNAP